MLWFEIWKNLKYEDNLQYENDLKYEDDLKNEDNLKYEECEADLLPKWAKHTKLNLSKQKKHQKFFMNQNDKSKSC